MRRLWEWLRRADWQTDIQWAMVVLVLVWVGMGLGGFVVVWSAATHQWAGILQGVSLLVFGWAILLHHR
ncbi:hypothetical protein [Sulfobacillus thermosulfidooxidans]|uniref:hypothetical protein n=1 Tax=Sulfobacillus thermosulfidooxidans TaxID=28034 RepID=UPI0002FCED20|nr:hypothetical protein [Sulfobacillus thermosulfidooxidans]